MMNSFFNNIPIDRMLDERQYNQIKRHNFELRKHSSEDRINHYLRLRTRLDSTENGTPAHGIYVALIKDLITRYEDVANYHRALELASDIASVASPAA